ncbi:glycine--tRNA ligase subunit beta [Novosphingobium sp.]|uniref:glycine--tRNA ligase subunit beta n=1 Tax=Novosphingobium sp. TaxID=1874826 RepID=UPI0025D14D16|nr:glycine--tRNA ligase subunit beta [Novosphingobium sp.]MCC6925642.1 glycine--tRNA ligase subunit beta [Novosphingobium sp.]
MSDFLLELRCEEIPARMQAGARADLEKLFRKEMDAAGVAVGELTVWSTPRRLALIARGLPAATAAVSEEVKGPRVGAPPQALEGFLRKTGLSEDQLVERDGVLFAITEKPGRATADVLAEAVPAIVRAFPWPKSQRWGAASLSSESLRWVRPLSAIVSLLDGQVVECEVGGIKAGRLTRGHRFHSEGELSIDGVDDYAAKLRAAHVIVDHTERQDLVRAGAAKAATAAGLSLVEDEGLVIENAGLTEWPVPLLGRFDESYLDVPPEVIQLTARTNQKYFVCNDSAGKLANAFVCTANIVASDGGAAIVDGNRKVLAARLSDARFFWEQDRKTSLADQAKKLSRITFHEKLGTVADKVERVAKLARWLVEEGIVASPERGGGPPRSGGGGGSPPNAALAVSPLHHPADGPPPRAGEDLADQAELAARLCKADLVTEMVGEFPELQGLMGGYYARAEGLPDAVADAIRDHYKPVGQGDDVPTAPVTVAVSLADKLDSLVQFFEIGLNPTGSKDPFALRRAAISTTSLILENGLRGSLSEMLLACTIQHLNQPGIFLSDGLLEFIIDRLKVQQREAGVRHDLIDAVFALGGEDDLVRLLARVHALQAFIGTDDGANLLAGYKRAANILKKEGVEAAEAISLSYTAEPAEKSLIDALDTAGPKAAAAVAAEDFGGAMAALASLRGPIDRFFDEVTVNDADPAKRAYRLSLLARLRDAVHGVADFSRIEG